MPHRYRLLALSLTLPLLHLPDSTHSLWLHRSFKDIAFDVESGVARLPLINRVVKATYLNIFADGPAPEVSSSAPPPLLRRASGPKPGVVVPRLVSTDWPFSTRPTAARELGELVIPARGTPLPEVDEYTPSVLSPRATAASYGSPLATATEVSDGDAAENDADERNTRTPVARRATLPFTALDAADADSVDTTAGFATLLSLPLLSDPELGTALHHLAASLEAYASVVAARRAGPHAAGSAGLLVGRDGGLLGPGRAPATAAPDALPVVKPESVHPAALPPVPAYTPAQRLLFLAASPALDGAWGPLVALVRALESTLDDATERDVIAELRAEFMGAMRGAIAPPNSEASVDVEPYPVVQYARVPSFPDIRQ